MAACAALVYTARIVIEDLAVPALELALLVDKPLPLLASDRERHLALLAGEQLSIHQLAQSLARDPAAVHHVVRAAVLRTRRARRPQTLHSLEQCLQILGKARLEELFLRLPTYRRRDAGREQHRQILGQSIIAAELARRWAIEHGQRHVDDIWLAALLYNQLLWLLSWHQADDFAQWGQRLLAHQQTRALEREHYGEDLAQLAQRLNADYTPLDRLIDCSLPGELPTARDYRAMAHGDLQLLRRYTGRASTWIVHANHLAARLIQQGPWAYSRLHALSSVSRSSADQLWRSTRDLLLHVADVIGFGPGIAGSLVWSAAPSAQRHLSLPYWCTLPPPPTASLAHLLEHLAAQTQLNSLLQTLIRLWQAAGLQRIALFVFSADRQKIRSLICWGWEKDSPLQSLQINVEHHSLLAALAAKTSLLVLDTPARARYDAHLPAAMAASLATPSLIGSLNNGDKALALLLADRRGQALGDSCLTAVRQSLHTAQGVIQTLRAQSATTQG